MVVSKIMWANQALLVFFLNQYMPWESKTKQRMVDDPCKGFPTTHGQSLVFGLPGYAFIIISIIF